MTNMSCAVAGSKSKRPGTHGTGPSGVASGIGRVTSGPASGTGAGFVVDDEGCVIRYRGVGLELTRYEYRLLKALVAKPGRVFSRDQLMAAAWEDPGASLDRTVDAHIKTLRAKLRAVAPEEDPIQTHRGLGYSLREGRGSSTGGGRAARGRPPSAGPGRTV